MKKIIAYLIFLIALFFYCISSCDNLSEQYTEWRNTTKYLSYDKSRFGDLFGLSYLPDYKKNINDEPIVVKQDKYKSKKNINLYCVCDSYLASFVSSDSIFYGINKSYKKHWYSDPTLNTKLDKSKINILLFEITERNLRNITDSNYFFNQIELSNNSFAKEEPKGFFSNISDVLYNPLFAQTLEFNLCDYPFTTPFKELKAQINYKFFNRMSKEISVSTDKKYLFYKGTVDDTLKSSSFSFAYDDEVEKIVRVFNATSKHFKKLGFKEVYFSIIPNPASILESDSFRYNKLIPRIQNNKNLETKIINVYDIYRKSKIKMYYTSDTHWNINGFNTWVNEFNKNISSLEN